MQEPKARYVAAHNCNRDVEANVFAVRYRADDCNIRKLWKQIAEYK